MLSFQNLYDEYKFAFVDFIYEYCLNDFSREENN